MEDILGVYLIIERYFCQFFIENILLALSRISSWAIVLGTDNKTCVEKLAKLSLQLSSLQLSSDTYLIVSEDNFGIFSIILHKSLCCGYLLKSPHWSYFNWYPQHLIL